MAEQFEHDVAKSQRIDKLKENLFRKLPQIEADRAVLLTESYKQTEALPIIKRRSAAFAHILEHLPITIRDYELVVGSNTVASRSCQTFPEYSYSWLEDEFETVGTRNADPFEITEETKRRLKEANAYWAGKTNAELAESYMTPETRTAIAHNIFTPGNYFYGGVGHITVNYGEVIAHGFSGVRDKAKKALEVLKCTDADYAKRHSFLEAVIESYDAAIMYAKRYVVLAKHMALECSDPVRKKELEQIAVNCEHAPEFGATNFREACQVFWFMQLLIQTEASGHSISPGRFDQYMYPYFKKDYEEGKITKEEAQELLDCIWIKLNDLNKCRDAASAEGFAGYSLFQNLIVGGQTKEGEDATNELSYMCINASMHTMLPQPSLSIRVWNGTPHELMAHAARLTRTGIGLPAYYNDEVIISALQARGLTLEDARNYNIIGCVEPHTSGKEDGWHDAAFYNMCRPIELVFHNGRDTDGTLVGLETGDVTQMKTFEEFYDAYKTQMNYLIGLMVNADNAIDQAHGERCPLPFVSATIEDCIGRGKSIQEGGAIYNFTGPQGFGISNMADGLYAIKKLVFEEKKVTLAEYKQALDDNFGKSNATVDAQAITTDIVKTLAAQGKTVTEDDIDAIYRKVNVEARNVTNGKYADLLKMINELPKFGNDIKEIDQFARDVAYTYTKPLQQYRNPRGGQYHAGLYPVSANVPLGAQTGATPDGRFAFTPVADGVSPVSGRDVHGPTASCNSVATLDHAIASNGTLFNMKFHPSALEGTSGINSFVALVRGFFDRKGMHMQFNVVSRETLIDAQKHPENYKGLVVRVAGYSALFTTLSKSLQDDIINRTEQVSM